METLALSMRIRRFGNYQKVQGQRESQFQVAIARFANIFCYRLDTGNIKAFQSCRR